MNRRCELPIPYPDELLYSIVARYHLRSNNSSPKWTLRDTFGTENVIATIDLPSHIGELSRRNIVKDIPVDHWIDEHTFYPFYAPFMPRDRALLLRKLMESEDGSGIHTLVGITASTFDRDNKLHFCPSCFDEDVQQYGEPFWHRIHQLPGVWVCPKHGDILHQMTYPVSERHGLTVLPISRRMFHSIPVLENISYKTFERLLAIAKDVQTLLQMKEERGLYNSKSLLLSRLSELGLLTPAERIRQKELRERFITFYGYDLLDKLESIPKQDDHTWLASATRSMRYTVHPLRQILLIHFLYGSFKAFIEQSLEVHSPFGKSPWPCLNKASEHYKEAIIQSCVVTRCSDTGRPVGTFVCECGYSYSRRGPDQNEEDKFHKGRVKSFGAIWLSKLHECLHAGLSCRSTARALGVDTNTVIKYSTFAVMEQRSKLKVNRIKKITSSKSLHSKEGKKARVNWEKRDLELSYQIEDVCKELLASNNKPVRIRVSVVGKRIGKLSMLEKHKDKLPITIGILNNYLESTAQFQCRRVRWAAEQMWGEWPLKKWKLVKKAGLRPGYLEAVENEINRCIGSNSDIAPLSTTEVIQWHH
ncbi:TnsD family Tn7-like transposition protein [Paenibacillus sp. FSL L8-0436]|uniref:TnsD family Tn7-like transposition protein n=1 Tax=Paenibacillus sp. FSL L8-0436 TaxID=2954686 RepID=UPI0031581266